MAIDLGNGIDLGLGLDLGEGINLDAGLVNPNQIIPQQEPKGFFATLRNTIDYVTIASTGNAADFGDLTDTNSRTSGTSDAHGGLQH